MIWNKKKIFKLIAIISFGLILFSSLINIYEKRHKVSKFFTNKIINSHQSKDSLITKKAHDSKNIYRSESYSEYDYNEDYHYWTKEISKGGYILFFRHAEREKWPIVMAYDAYENHKDLNIEETSLSKAVCLSERGIEQAKLMKFYIELSKMKISEVISSTSCRARQTANLVFGKIDKISNNLIHYGPWNESRKEHLDSVKKILKTVNLIQGENIIITAHNGVIQKYLFDEIDDDFEQYNIDEGGFYIIAKDNKNKLILKKKIKNFLYFSRYLIKRN